jgi:AraC-like DNA-binding protein
VPLAFNDFVITSMVRGKKIMHLKGRPSFEYLPGESVILPAHETMVIDFPTAHPENPTQCIALTVDEKYVMETLQYLNTYYSQRDDVHNWKLQFNQYHFSNDNEVTDLINKLIRACMSSDKSKDIFADLNLKELLIRLVQSQYLIQVEQEHETHSNHTRLHYIIHYIHEHLSEKIAVNELSRRAYLSRNIFFKFFKEQCGITPLEYINRERVQLAKQLLRDKRHKNIRDVGCMSGFSDVNYFIRVFKKMEGITPKAYQLNLNNA